MHLLNVQTSIRVQFMLFPIILALFAEFALNGSSAVSAYAHLRAAIPIMNDSLLGFIFCSDGMQRKILQGNEVHVLSE